MSNHEIIISSNRSGKTLAAEKSGARIIKRSDLKLYVPPIDLHVLDSSWVYRHFIGGQQSPEQFGEIVEPAAGWESIEA